MAKSRNWVGWSTDSTVVPIHLPLRVQANITLVSGNGLPGSLVNIDASVDAEVRVQAKNMNTTQHDNRVYLKKNAPEDIFFLHIFDRCA